MIDRSTLLAAILLLSSCSVLEDRSSCPYVLRLNFSSVDVPSLLSEGYEELKWSFGSPEGGLQGVLSLEDLGESFEIEVPKEDAELIVTLGDDGIWVPGEGFVIPEGRDAPRLLAFSCPCPAATGEYSEVEVVPHKRYAMLDIKFEGVAGERPLIRISGNCAGYDTDLQPLPGDFCVDLVPDAQGECSLVLPAQRDNSLRLSLIYGGEMLREFALGTYIESTGYDWSARDLEDISITVEYDGTSAVFYIDQWRKIFVFSFVF